MNSQMNQVNYDHFIDLLSELIVQYQSKINKEVQIKPSLKQQDENHQVA